MTLRLVALPSQIKAPVILHQQPLKTKRLLAQALNLMLTLAKKHHQLMLRLPKNHRPSSGLSSSLFWRLLVQAAITAGLFGTIIRQRKTKPVRLIDSISRYSSNKMLSTVWKVIAGNRPMSCRRLTINFLYSLNSYKKN